MRSRSLSKMAYEHASTLRNPSVATSGVTLDPVTYLADVLVLPLMPVTDDIVKRYALSSPREAFVTYAVGNPDILEGDILVVDGSQYPVRAASPWEPHTYIEVIVDRVVGT
jgi:hypothetical protein